MDVLQQNGLASRIAQERGKERKQAAAKVGELGETLWRHAGRDAHQHTTQSLMSLTSEWLLLCVVRLSFAFFRRWMKIHVRWSNVRGQTNSDRACMCVCYLNDYDM